jgi:lipopolysaccharide transport system ATP-binding protein
MSDDVVIRAEGLGKKYAIGHATERERYTALRDVLVRGAHNVWRKTVDMARGRPIVTGDSVEEFWALKDISFEVKRGEVLGIIGRNGAGKSTLLKILSRITEPSAGRVTIKGRVASLLEVGTGFHPELTGRENIYLNGAILGMTRAEVRRKFDEIVAFAEVEKFLDTPVKRYSSGMYVRLAFAVAAHLEPEIFIVDEVLAVGDAEFQKKCLGKMGEVAGHDRTVLFVSHNMASIRALSTSALLLQNGRVGGAGEAAAVIASYFTSGTASMTTYQRTEACRSPSIARAKLSQQCSNKLSTQIFRIDQEISLDIEIDNPERKLASINIHIIDSSGAMIFHFSDEFGNDEIFKKNNRRCIFPPYAFNSGSYQISIILLERNVQLFETIDSALSFTIEKAGRVFNRTSGEWLGTNGPGLFQWVSQES